LFLEDGTRRLFRNVGKELPLISALQPRRAQLFSTSRWKPEIKPNLFCLLSCLWQHSAQQI